MPGSPAIDGGSTDLSIGDDTHDQRGMVRPFDAPAADVDDGSDVGSVEAQPPPPPTLTDTDPDSPSTDFTPLVKGAVSAADSVSLYEDSSCSNGVGTGTAADYPAPGIEASASTNTLNTFYATSTNAFGESLCSSSLPLNGSIDYVHDSIAPETVIDSGPTDPTDHTPTFGFHGIDATPVTFACSADTGAPSFSPCASPFTTPALGDGSYIFRARAIDGAGNVDATPVTLPFTLSQPAVPPPTSTPAAPTRTCPKGKKLKRGKCVKKKRRKK
jgi:hypothetical protein